MNILYIIIISKIIKLIQRRTKKISAKCLLIIIQKELNHYGGKKVSIFIVT